MGIKDDKMIEVEMEMERIEMKEEYLIEKKI